MGIKVLLEGKVLGQKRPIFTDWVFDLPPIWEQGGDRCKLRDLITVVVQKEVEEFKERQEKLRFSQVLSQEQIQQGAEKGEIDSGERNLQQTICEEVAIATALQAFSDGLYYVFIDNEQQTNLNSEVYLKNNSKVIFIRLTALAGG